LPSLAATRGFGAGLAAEDFGRMGLLSLFGCLPRKCWGLRLRLRVHAQQVLCR